MELQGHGNNMEPTAIFTNTKTGERKAIKRSEIAQYGITPEQFDAKVIQTQVPEERKNVLQQVADFMIPKIKENVIDPVARTGGMALDYGRYVMAKTPEEKQKIGEEYGKKYAEQEKWAGKVGYGTKEDPGFKPGRFAKATGKTALETASMVAPAGKGLKMGAVTGALSGGARGLSEGEDFDLAKGAVGAVTGGVVGGTLGKIGEIVQNRGLSSALDKHLRPTEKEAIDMLKKGVSFADVAKKTNFDVAQNAMRIVNEGEKGQVTFLIDRLAQTGDKNTDKVVQSWLQKNPGSGLENMYDTAKKSVFELTKNKGNLLTRAGEQTIQSQYNLPRSMAKDMSFGKKLADFGFTNRNQIDEIAGSLTGPEGALNKIKEAVIAKAKPVDLADIEILAQNLADDPLIPAGQDKKFVDFILKGIKNLQTTGTRSTTSQGATQQLFQGNPLDTFTFIKSLEKKAGEIGSKSISLTSSDKALQQAYRGIAEELKNRLFTQSGADDLVVSALEGSPIVKSIMAQYPKLGEAISKAKTIADIRAIEAPFVQSSIASKVTEQGANSAISGLKQGGKGVARLLPSLADPLAPVRAGLESDTAASLVGGGLIKAGKIADKTLPAIQQTVGKTLAPIEDIVSKVPQSAATSLSAKAATDTVMPTHTPQPAVQGATTIPEMPQSEQMFELTNAETGETKIVPQSELSQYGLDEQGQPMQQEQQTQGVPTKEQFQQAILQQGSLGTASGRSNASSLMQQMEMFYPKASEQRVTEASKKRQDLAKFGMRGLDTVKQELGLVDQAGNPLTGDMIDSGKVDKTKIFQGTINKVLTPKIKAAMFRTIQGILRMQTGAVAPASEVESYMNNLAPQWYDDDNTIKYKLKSLEQDYMDAINIEVDRQTQSQPQTLPDINSLIQY